MIVNLTAAKKVHAAIKAGARTQWEIRKKTKLPEDQIGDALAHLLITARMIRTETDNSTRLYFPAVKQHGLINDSPLSFSTMQGLMPRTSSFRC